MNTAELKLELFRRIDSLPDERLLAIRQPILDILIHAGEVVREVEESDGFLEWNKQFEDDRELSEFIPEYGMTLGEFRRDIYESETSEEGDMTLDEFIRDHKEWKEKNLK